MQDHQSGRSGLANDSDQVKDYVTGSDDWLHSEGTHEALLLPRPPPCCQGTAVDLRCELQRVTPRPARCSHGPAAAAYKLSCRRSLLSPHNCSGGSQASNCNADTASFINALFVCRFPGKPVLVQLSEVIVPELRRSVMELTAFVQATSTFGHQPSPATNSSSCKECVSTPPLATLPFAKPCSATFCWPCTSRA